MPFSAAFEQHQLLDRFRQLRRKPVAAHGVAIIVVGIATALRWLIDPQLVSGLPFITYYPAIIVATLIAGFWPGVLSLILSATAAWYFFLPPFQSWQLESLAAFSLLFFVVMSSVNIAIILILDMTLQRVIDQERNVRILIESAPNGILVVDTRGQITLVNESMEKLFGYKRSELQGRNIDDLVADSARQNHQALRDSYCQKPEARA